MAISKICDYAVLLRFERNVTRLTNELVVVLIFIKSSLIEYTSHHLSDPIRSLNGILPQLGRTAPFILRTPPTLNGRTLLPAVFPFSASAAMSGRLLRSGALDPLTRRAPRRPSLLRRYHRLPTGGLQGADAAVRATRRRIWPPGNSFHDAVIVRNASFARFLPKLVVKFARIPAMFGGLMIGGIAWIQYQAIRKDPLHP